MSGAVVGALEHGDVHTLGIHLGTLQVGFGGAQVRFRTFQLCARLMHLGRDLFLVKLGQHRALLYHHAFFDHEFLDNAAGLVSLDLVSLHNPFDRRA